MMHFIPACRSLLSLLAPVLVLATATASHAADSCRAKVDRKTGVIRVDAKNVGGPLLWGDAPGSETNALFNAGTCIAGGTAKKCELADPATLASKTAPSGCTVYLDDGVADCSAWIPGCSPGARSDTGLALIDADGTVIGPVQDGGFPYAYLENGGTDVKIAVRPDGTDFHPLFGLYYTTVDCSGSPLMSTVSASAIVEAFVRPPTAYVSPTTGSMQMYNSFLGLYAGLTSQGACDAFYGMGMSTFVAPFGCCQVMGGSTMLDAPAGTIDLSGYSTPFRIDVR